MSIRLRLTLLYTAILALTLIAFSVTLYLNVRRVTFDVVKSTLAAEAQRLESASVRNGVLEPQAASLTKQNTFAQARGLDGRVLASTRNLLPYEFNLPLNADQLREVQEARPQSAIVRAPGDNGRLFVYL